MSSISATAQRFTPRASAATAIEQIHAAQGRIVGVVLNLAVWFGLHVLRPATGGTVRAVSDLVRRMGGEVVECAFLAELTFLKGRDKLQDIPIHSLIQF